MRVDMMYSLSADLYIFKLLHEIQVCIRKMTLPWLSSVKSSNYEGSGHTCMLCFVYLCIR